MTTKIIPLEDRTVVRVSKMDKKTDGGIIIPDEYKEKHDMAQLEAEVVAIGELAFVDCNVKPEVGDAVLITKYAGLLYTIDGVEYRTVTPDGIVGILK